MPFFAPIAARLPVFPDQETGIPVLENFFPDNRHREFCKKSLQLQFVVEGTRVADNAFKWNERERNWNVVSADRRKFQWSYDSGDGLPFWYIPVEFLP